MMKNTKGLLRRIVPFLMLVWASLASFAQEKVYSAYLFAYFKGEGLSQGEQIYFAVSRDGLHWTDLNDGNPVLVSTMGEKGLRDPFIMRSADGEKFYVIATDLKINGNGNWSAAQTTGSKSIMVWESTDLVHWSEQRMCRVAPDGAGCTWAPEAVYDDASGQYLVFWSSKIPSGDNTHRVYYCTTKDFKSFSEAKVWIELRNASNRVISVIDATAIKVGDTYYRFKKNEATEPHKNGLPSGGKYIIMEKSNSLLGNWTEISSDMSSLSGVEGPTCFKFNNEEKWCLLLDDFGGKGYFPLVTSDLSSGRFTQLNSSQYSFPSVMRHGSVINLTEDEYFGLLAKYDPNLMTTVSLNPASKQQTMEGWGVSLCWWANMCGKWDDSKVDELVKLLTDENGLNYNIFRYNIGGGDDPSHYNGHMCNGKGKRAEMDGFKASANSGYDWSKDPGQRKVLEKIHKARPDAIFEAFSNSAPYWMTYSGCSSGHSNASSDNLKPEYYEQFCDYLIEVCKHFKSEYGVEFKTLDPFNEPNTNYWGANGGQEGCHFDPSSQVKLLRVLYPKLKQSGLKTVISACDETSVNTAIDELKLYRKEGDIVGMLGQFNVHTYGGNTMDRINLKDLVRESGLPLWMSETGAGGTGLQGNLSLAQRMFDDLNYMLPQAWVDWQFVEEGNDQWCLVQGNFSRQSYSIVKNYYVRMQVTRFIKQGYSMLSTGRGDILAAVSPDGKEVVVVMLNTGSNTKLVNVDLTLLKNVSSDVKLYVTNSKQNCQESSNYTIDSETFSYVMGGEEIATAVFCVSPNEGITGLNPEAAYMIVPRAASGVLSAESSENLKLAILSAGDSLQCWRFRRLSNGNYQIYTKKNGKEMAITDDGSYYLQLTELRSGNGSQEFRLVEHGENCYTIISASDDKWFDLEGVNTSIGTNVGVWEAGGAGENAHREWRIIPFPYANAAMMDPTSLPEGIVAQAPLVYAYGEADGLRVVNFSSSKMDLRVYNMGGVCERTLRGLSDAFVSVPLPKGPYIVVYDVQGERGTTKVLVK